jgi:DNA-binding transcriptional LysR family regulator
MVHFKTMQDVELSSIDLNLLVSLQALLIERHVTRAARRARTSQPAMSRSLARLRELFADELLVRVGKAMRPTPRAADLLPQLQVALASVRDLISPTRFVPREASGMFRIAAPDILAYMLVPRLLRHLAREAPGIDVDVVQWSHRWREHLESGEVDLTVGQPTGNEPGIYSRVLVRNTWASVLRRGHPALARRWTKERFADLPHLLIGFDRDGGGQVDAALAAYGLRRRVALRMPYVVMSPLVVAETDLVLTTARWLAEKLASGFPLVLKRPPIDLTPVELPLVWHERTHRDPRQRWFREALLAAAHDEAPLARRMS